MERVLGEMNVESGEGVGDRLGGWTVEVDNDDDGGDASVRMNVECAPTQLLHQSTTLTLPHHQPILFLILPLYT